MYKKLSLQMDYTQLKIFAVICMFYDHVTRVFPLGDALGPLADYFWENGMKNLAEIVLTWLPYAFSYIGRLAAPVFLFCIVNGYLHTRNVKRYTARIAWTAVLAQVPYVWFNQAEMQRYGAELSWRDVDFNILFTLALGLAALALFGYLKERGHAVYGVIAVTAAGVLARLLSFEGKEGYILIIFVFYLMKDWPKKAEALVLIPTVALSRARLITIGFFTGANVSMIKSVLLNVAGNYLGTLVPVFLYNGEKGKGGVWFRRFMYAFYPLHLLLLTAAYYLKIACFQ